VKRLIEVVSVKEGILARVEMLDNLASETCNRVWQILPVTGYFTHAIYSGAEVALVLPQYFPLEPENSQTVVLPWEIFYLSLRADDHYDVDCDFSGLGFFYDRNPGPRMLERPVRVNVFAQFVTGQDDLFRLCMRMRRGEGRQNFTIRHA
jgi:hypothetical protein